MGNSGGEVYSSSLLAHLTKNFAPHPENVATEALGHILAHSASARNGLTSILSGTGISENLSYRTQQAEGDSLARPDLTGRDDQGRNVVLIEAKFWAGLTDNQPNTYIAMLADDVPSTLCFLIPQERMTSLWPEVCSRASDTGFSVSMEHDGEYKSAWLASELPRTKQHPTMLLGRPAIKDERSFTGKVESSAGPSRGTVLSEGIGSNFFTANVTVERDSLLMLKATYHPNWRATVDGIKTDTVLLMPSFVGVQLPPGDHEVRIEYRPRRLRAILIGLGLLALLLIAIGEKRSTALSGWFTTSVLARMSGAVKRPRGARRRQRPRHRIRR